MKNHFQPTDDAVWGRLQHHRAGMAEFRLEQAFNKDPGRFDNMHLRAAGLCLDYSRNLVTVETISLLVEAAVAADVPARIDAMFRGDKVNPTEDRPALHTALRDFTANAPYHNEVSAAFSRMEELVDAINGGEWRGSSGKAITDVVNIGIGGSHLGPMMVADALAAPGAGRVRCHFVSNIDSTDIQAVLSGLDPRSTLFIVSSKSFTTLETLRNATTAREWLQSGSGMDTDLSRHFLAVSANPDRAGEFGIAPENVLPMWDWVGGRYSLWSAIGIAAALAMGMDRFNRLRQGAAAMDQHFREAALAENLPVLLALLDIWYVNYWDTASHAVLPYNHHLRYFPEFLQQLEMESNGKSAGLDNNLLDYATAPVLWGTVETNGQHSFHQLLHQGSRWIPVDFIVSLQPDVQGDEHHPYLYANCLAQAYALMTGRSRHAVTDELINNGVSANEAAIQAVHREMPGNRPSTTILMDEHSPETVGALIALYEHKVYVESLLWNINAFDQWGVELGKGISNQVYGKLTDGATQAEFDPSTEALIEFYRKANNTRTG